MKQPAEEWVLQMEHQLAKHRPAPAERFGLAAAEFVNATEDNLKTASEAELHATTQWKWRATSSFAWLQQWWRKVSSSYNRHVEAHIRWTADQTQCKLKDRNLPLVFYAQLPLYLLQILLPLTLKTYPNSFQYSTENSNGTWYLLRKKSIERQKLQTNVVIFVSFKKSCIL